MSAHARTRSAEPFEYWRLKLLRMLEPGIWSFKTTVDAACARSIVAFDDVAPEDLNHHRDPAWLALITLRHAAINLHVFDAKRTTAERCDGCGRCRSLSIVLDHSEPGD